ncbi:hypothetical protein BTHERMOSOX_534 [Bathymodiolus thermophilus thioautotrophic gill symbiont]|uniref:Lcl C-terminal domain-containing protein n=1 Tax=Bathymodiolus thermophilus thioautotrophic gill symbiont TaxID=2360 RepID=UPI0010BBD56E|nr:DUF1566 domain-containing protein [Bathymodiolus thermophilus thioautotrophic gill symbiont]SHA18287.1 hypothetical protein BTHERMOSOX_534 [Bathymodiolus thermophilus thioautotrophic gill symbiont]
MKKIILFLTINLIFLANNYLLAQTCENYVPNKWPNSRYTDHSNGTVTDNQTKLMWKKCAEGLSGNDCNEGTGSTYNWTQALQSVNSHSFASHDDWRLPNIKELSSLAARHCYDPSINLSFFPNTPANYFWSSSPSVSAPFNNFSLHEWAWRLNFEFGSAYYDERNISNYYVRLVRSVE